MRGKKKKFQFDINDSGCFTITSHHVSDPSNSMVTVKRGKKVTIPRYIYEECFGELPNGMVVRHKCDNHHCVNPEHMESGTPFDNVQDRVSRNRCAKGERNAGCKLTIEQAKEIKGLQGVEPIGKIAQRYGIGTTQIWRIWTGENWKAVI